MPGFEVPDNLHGRLLASGDCINVGEIRIEDRAVPRKLVCFFKLCDGFIAAERRLDRISKHVVKTE